MKALMAMPRILVIDNVTYTTAAAAGSGSTGGGPVGKVFEGPGAAPQLQVQISGRVFAQAPAGTVATGTGSGSAATPGSAGGGTPAPATNG